MRDLGFSVSYMLAKYVSWKSTIRILFPFPIFHQQNKDMNQSERRPRLFSCGGSERAVWNALTMGCFNFFLEFFFGGVPLVRPCCLPSYLRGFWIHWRLAVCAASLLWPRLSRTTSRNASCCSLNVSSMSRRSSRIYDCFCNASKRSIFKHKCHCCWSADRWTNAMTRSTFSFNKF